MNALIHYRSVQEWKARESRVRHARPKMPYHMGETKLEQQSSIAYSLRPGLAPGGDNRKMGVKQKGTDDQIQGRDNDPITTWEKTLEM